MKLGTSLVVQSLRLCAPNAGGQVWSLGRELDPTCIPQLRVCMPQLKDPARSNEDPVCCNKDTTHATTKTQHWDFPGDAVVKNPPANAGDTGSSPGPRRSHMPRSN